MAIVHSYARFSCKKQQHGDSARRQKEQLDKFIAAGSHTLSSLQYLDDGKSSFKGDKQKYLNEFLAILAANDGRIKPGDILYVEAIDRLSRKGIRQTQSVVNTILEAGVDIRISLPLEKTYYANKTNDLGDAIELAAFAYAAHVYSGLLSGRIKSFHAEARELARRTKKPINSGPTPAWLIRTKDGFKFKPGAKEAIQYIYARTTEGIGGKILTRELNAKFSPCFGYNGTWNERYMRAILNDRRAMGEFQPREGEDRQEAGEPIAGYFPAAVTEEQWRDANASSQNRRKEKGPTKEYVNIFTGLVNHAVDQCPCQIYQYRQKRADGRLVIYRRLKSVHASDGVTGASTETIDIGDFEHVVLHRLEELDLSVFDGGRSQQNELQSLVSLVERKERRIDEIQADEETPVVQLNKQLAKLRGEVAELKIRISKIKVTSANSNVSTFETLKKLVKMDMTTAANRQLLREAIKKLVKEINVMPAKLGKQRKSPVGSMIEIVLHNGIRKRFLQLGKKSSATVQQADDGFRPTPEKLKSALTTFAATTSPADGLGLHFLADVLYKSPANASRPLMPDLV